MEHTQRICCCDERYIARAAGEFVYMEQWRGWVFPNDKPRWASNGWRSSYYGTDDHSGEPTIWLDCPFCGGELPPQDSFNPYLGTEGATDGGEGPEA